MQNVFSGNSKFFEFFRPFDDDNCSFVFQDLIQPNRKSDIDFRHSNAINLCDIRQISVLYKLTSVKLGLVTSSMS